MWRAHSGVYRPFFPPEAGLGWIYTHTPLRMAYVHTYILLVDRTLVWLKMGRVYILGVMAEGACLWLCACMREPVLIEQRALWTRAARLFLLFLSSFFPTPRCRHHHRRRRRRSRLHVRPLHQRFSSRTASHPALAH